jgi:hypothetical protein
MHRRRVRGWVALLLAPALALRLFVPAGFMAASADGALSMQMCHGDARSAIVIRTTQGGEVPAPHGGDHQAPCVFAATAAAAPPPLAAIVLAGAPVPQAPESARIAAPFLRSIHRTQSPRAPPSMV